MAGSYQHVTDKTGKFRLGDSSHVETMGDAMEALEEMHFMIWWLAYHTSPGRFFETGVPERINNARNAYDAWVRGEGYKEYPGHTEEDS